ncbi:protein kinase [Lactobacillus delbrueckii subsp. lactis]|nr:protein kinase [Lactobacillus delbrueckii]MCD5440516.1 protein kinase [Lactobacillus delbrueckii subsp. lactis]
MHQQTPPIIHRDIKPENIFYDGQKLILADFDIARNMQEDADRDTRILGSVGYAAPEQFGFSQSGPASDFYAVGVLMNVLYTGYLPSVRLYKGPEREIIEKATHINSQKRYQNAREFKDAITGLGRSSWLLPGFRSHQPARMLTAGCGYLLMLFSSFSMDAKSDSAADSFLLRLSFFMVLFLIVLFACNYRNIKSMCLFHSSKSKFTRACGIIISYLLVATVLTTALAALSVAISSFGN